MAYINIAYESLNLYAFHFTIKCQAEKRNQREEYDNTVPILRIFISYKVFVFI